MVKALDKQFNKVIQNRNEKLLEQQFETKKQRLDRISRRLGIVKHGKGKRKRKKKK